jgi:hypothetical protein
VFSFLSHLLLIFFEAVVGEGSIACGERRRGDSTGKEGMMREPA